MSKIIAVINEKAEPVLEGAPDARILVREFEVTNLPKPAFAVCPASNSSRAIFMFTLVSQALAAAAVLCQLEWCFNDVFAFEGKPDHTRIFLAAVEAAEKVDLASANPIKGLDWDGQPLPF